MAKILITSVGTGDIRKDSDGEYELTTYMIEDKPYKNTLTSQVIVEHYDIDKIIFVGTRGSMWDNLYFLYDGKDESYMDTLTQKKKDNTLELGDLGQFCQTIDSYLGQDGSSCLLLDYQQNDSNEIWQNFELLTSIREQINDGDEIYLDITHGFRYMPILNIFLLEFLTIMHSVDFRIMAILYGMFAGTKSEIIDFKIFFDLLEWMRAITAFKRYGDGWTLSNLMKEESLEASKVFLQFGNTLGLAHMHALWKFIKDANKKVRKIENAENKIVKLLSEDIIDLTKRFDQEQQSAFQYELAKWLYEQRNYALSYIALYEAIVTKVCEDKGYDILDHKQREEAKRRVDYPYDKLFLTKYNDSISKIRNEIVHQGNERQNRVNQDINKLKEFIESFESFFN